MTDVAQPEGQAAEPQGPFFRVLAQYVRDLSFENPRAPDSLRLEGRPDVEMGVEMNARGRPDGLYEVDMRLSVKATANQAALFQLGGFGEGDIEPMLLIECPRYLFPFARQIIAACTSDGGFYPPFLLEPIDFATVYSARKAQNAGQLIGHA
jgi:preprotein translocase subunit SecB